jgi:hypothetical protein
MQYHIKLRVVCIMKILFKLDFYTINWKLKIYNYQIFHNNGYNFTIVSPSQSTVTGTALSAFNALSDTLVTVTAKDAGGTNVGTGGDLFYVQITNRCTKASNFACTVNGGADTTIVTAITALMTDNNDGTYTYILNHNNEGTLSISVILYNRFSVYGTWYNTDDLTGAVANTNISTSISYYWGNYNVTTTLGDYVSGKMEGYIKSPYSGSVELILYTDNLAALWIDGALGFYHMSVGCV